MFTITLKKYSNNACADVYFDLVITHAIDQQILNLEFTLCLSLVLEDGFSIKDIGYWSTNDFTVLTNKLFTEKELAGLQKDCYTLDAREGDSREMVILKEQLSDFLDVLLERIEIKVYLTPESA